MMDCYFGFQAAFRSQSPVDATCERSKSLDEMVDGIEAGQADDNEIDRDNEIEQPRHQEDENTADQGDKRRDMGGSDDHEIL
jgi:hypothetical protein